MAPQTPGSLSLVMFAGRLHVGASASFTVTVKEQLVLGLSGLASLAVQLTVVVPTENVEPDAGKQLIVAPGQLSLALAL